MSSIARPTFFEGQLLAAADLDEVVNYQRARSERHHRLVHRWGIVSGLELKAEPAKDKDGNDYKRIFVEPGMALAADGREILLTERTELDPARFLQLQGSNIDEASFYPVFLRSEFRAQAPTAGPMGLCQTLQGNRIEEAYDLSFGRLGDETSLEEIEVAILASTPTPAEGGSSAPVLLGFVKWTKVVEKFADAVSFANRVRRRYVGINAASVVGYEQRVALQTQGKLTQNKPILELSEDNGGQLRFGLFKPPHDMTELLVVKGNGEMIVAGESVSKLTAGKVLVQSGQATDGTILPLPDADSATVHVLVTPRVDASLSPDPSQHWAALVQECRVDSDRRLHCRICWFQIAFTAAPNQGQSVIAAPGVCDFLVLAMPKDNGGA